jgi:hypothetical protein
MRLTWSVIAKGKSTDDQRNLNSACSSLPFVKTDVDHRIFQNCGSMEQIRASNAYVCQLPGTVTWHRSLRVIPEYAHYFLPEIAGVAAFVAVCFLLLANRKKIKRKK